MTSSDTRERPGIEELYELATNTSNLRQEAEKRGAADVLRDMAMSTDRLGAALRRLRGQWEAVEKPTRQRTRSVKQWLEILPMQREGTYVLRNEDGTVFHGTRLQAAEAANREERERHDKWFQGEMQRLVGQLADLPAVRDAVTIQAVKWGMEDAETKAAAIVRYWLDQTCPACQGRKWQVVPNSPGLSNKMCPNHGGCGGTGVAPVPHGQDGRKLANHMDQCLHRHKQTLKARRKALGAIPPIDRLSKRMQPGGPDPEAD